LPAGVECVTWTQVDGGAPPALDGFSHLLHSGSAWSINADPPFVEVAMERVREGVARGLAQLGICYGHQLLARALGGRGAVRRCPAGLQVGWCELGFAEEGQRLLALPARCRVWHYHFDEVRAPPAGARVLASDAHCAVQAFHDPARRLLGTQFHPEIDPAVGAAIFRAQAAELAAHGHDAEDLCRGTPRGLAPASFFARFFDAI
jgi:GMP synthase-like glutamine amidotransferase